MGKHSLKEKNGMNQTGVCLAMSTAMFCLLLAGHLPVNWFTLICFMGVSASTGWCMACDAMLWKIRKALEKQE